MDSNERFDRADTALRNQPGKWFCMQCWSNASGVTVKNLRALVNSMTIEMGYEVSIYGGTCDIGQHSVTDEPVIRVPIDPRIATPS
jgi:hypothetical protein